VREKQKPVPLADRLRSPLEPDRPLQDKLRSPRETLKTLYFALVTYDLFPQMIDDAVACLDLDGLQPRPGPEHAALLALDLEYVLQSLALPLGEVPDQGAGERVVLHEGEGYRLTLRVGADGAWRFDSETLARVPVMRRAARERRGQRAADQSALRDGFTDPRSTMRQFISDAVRGDFYAAARALDLSALSNEQRRRQGPTLAQQLAFVLQRRGYLFRQEVPDNPEGPPYTWHADRYGRLALERLRLPDGKDAWLFTKQTVRNIPRMYEAVKDVNPDPHYARLALVVPALQDQANPAALKRPDDVPAHLGSPRAMLQGFFRTMDAPDANDSQLAEALEYLDLDNVPLADRPTLGGKLAAKLDAVLRKLTIDLSSIPDDWNSGPQVLGEAHGVRVEIVRQYDGTWNFSEATVARIPEMFDRLAGKARSDQGPGSQLDSARDTVMTFQAAARRRDFVAAARCLNLGDIHPSARDELGPVLAFKLEYVLERIGRIYVQEIPDKPEWPRYDLYRGELGRITLDRRGEDPSKGQWQFIPETVQQIEGMFRGVFGRPPDASADVLAVPRFREAPALWLRLRLPAWAQVRTGKLDLYQWVGIVLAAFVSWIGARLTTACVTRLVAWFLRRSGSALSGNFVGDALRPLTCLTGVWAFFMLLQGLDLRVGVAGTVYAAEKFLLAASLGWLGVRLMDLTMGVYTNTEILLPHRSLSDLIVPVSVRLGKTVVILIVTTYVIYQFGEVDLLGRFLTGVGVAGLAASLAAQDAMKSYFGTLLLIGERAFKIGDRISVGGNEGVVEQVGFRSTKLRSSEGSLLTVPNAVIAGAAIVNMGARRRCPFGVTIFAIPGKPAARLEELRELLRAWLERQTIVVRDKVDVALHPAGDAGTELRVGGFLSLEAPADEARFHEALRSEILRLTASLGVEVSSDYRREPLDPAPESVPSEKAA
jgi:MscS family membrane protein